MPATCFLIGTPADIIARLPLQTLAIELEGFSWRTESDEKTEQGRDEKERTPQVLIFPGGELSPFVLTLTQQNEDVRYLRTAKADEFGRLRLLQDEEEEK